MTDRARLEGLRKKKRLAELRAKRDGAHVNTQTNDVEANQAALASLGVEGDASAPSRAQPEQQSGNPVSRFLRDAGQSSITQDGDGLADSAFRFAANAGAAIAEDPLQALVVDPLSAPVRATGEFRQASDALAQGEFREAGSRAVRGLTAAGETALIAAPGAGTAGRQFASQASRQPVSGATKKALARLQEADPDLAGTAARAQRLNEADIPATVADLTTRQGQSRLIGASRRDGPGQDLAQDAFEPRQAQQFERVSSEVKQAFGVEEDFTVQFERIAAERLQRAEPLYREAHEAPTQITNTIADLLRRPPLRKAVKQAEDLAAIDGVRLSQLGDSGIPVVRTRTANGGVKLQGDTARLHYMRQALDDQIDKFRNQNTGKVEGKRGQALTRLRRQFNEAIRDGNPAFAQADEIWSSDTAALTALERGVKAASFSTERQLRQLQRDAIRAGDEEFFRIGFAQGLVEKLGRGGSDASNRTLKLLDKEKQKQIRAVLGDEAGEALLNRVRVEDLMTRAGNRISPNVNSITAEAAQQTASQAIQLLFEGARGNITGAALSGVRAVGGKAVADRIRRQQQDIDEALIRLATEDPQELMRLINESATASAEGVNRLSVARGTNQRLIGAGVTATEQATAQN